MSRFVLLSDGRKMPLLGLGCWQAAERKSIADAVKTALLTGYRLIDSAALYGNEDQVGVGIRAALDTGALRRDELFVITKLPPYGMYPGKVEGHLRESLKQLGLEYVDLYLVHHPVGLVEREPGDYPRFGKPQVDNSTDLIPIWREMENMVRLGLTKAIGVSNFNARQLLKISSVSEIPPVVNQVECHVYFQQRRLRETCRRFNIAVMAYGSLGSSGRAALEKGSMGSVSSELPNLLANPVVRLVAERRGRTPAQVLLRFLVQQDIIVIPKSSNEDRMRQNGDLFSFTLDELDMAALGSLDQGEAGRYFDYNDFFTGYSEHPEFPFQ